MRIGLALDGSTDLTTLLAAAEAAASAGFPAVWLSDVGGWDPLTVAALVGQRTPGLQVGTAIVQLLGRHPLHLAGQALTTQAAAGGRLTLGVGPSHAPIVEQRFGLSWDRPLLQVRERLDLLGPLLAGESVDVHGETVSATGGVAAPGVSAPDVLLAAHGPQMLALAGQRADGAITIWARPELVADFIAPTVARAAVTAGRPAPRIVVGLNVTLTDDPDAARRFVAEKFAAAANMPSYRGALVRQGLVGVEDTVVVGDKAAIRSAVDSYEKAGATELIAFVTGRPSDGEGTVAALAELAREAAS